MTIQDLRGIFCCYDWPQYRASQLAVSRRPKKPAPEPTPRRKSALQVFLESHTVEEVRRMLGMS